MGGSEWGCVERIERAGTEVVRVVGYGAFGINAGTPVVWIPANKLQGKKLRGELGILKRVLLIIHAE